MMRMPNTSINKLHVEKDFETYTRIPTVSDLFTFLFFVFFIFFSFFCIPFSSLYHLIYGISMNLYGN